MSGEIHVYTQPRVERIADNQFYYDPPLDYIDGYRVTVGWSEEGDAWIAVCSGMSSGVALAHGLSKESALLSLCCCLAAHIDAVNPAAEDTVRSE